jgi:glycosyltransferase involved in cell wall biosynthesis
MCANGDELNLSIIAPAFNEADCLPALVESLVQTLRPLEQRFEIILVDDASTDETAAVISNLCKSHPEVRGIRHRINSGQSAAVISGMQASRGRLLVTLDADMQNPPSEIPRLLAQLTPETDAVCGVRTQRNDPFVRRISSKIANAVRDRITGVPVKDAGCGMRLMRRSAVQELPVFNGLHRFITTILKLQGFTVREVPIAHSPRLAGLSKYGIGNRLWRGIVDCYAMRWYARRVVSPVRSYTNG